MTEEERFQKIYNIYLNYEHELAQRGMENVAPIAASLTQSFIIHQAEDRYHKSSTISEVMESVNSEEWDTQP